MTCGSTSICSWNPLQCVHGVEFAHLPVWRLPVPLLSCLLIRGSKWRGRKERWWLEMWRARYWHPPNRLCCCVWMSRCAAAAVPLAYGCAAREGAVMLTSTWATRVVTSSSPAARKRKVPARCRWRGSRNPDRLLCQRKVPVIHRMAICVDTELLTWKTDS